MLGSRLEFAHFTLASALATLLVVGACGGSLPQPPAAPVSAADYVSVPFAPRPPPPEYVPPSPSKDAVWVDGGWEWLGDRYVWRFGTWAVAPAGARRARWVLVRRPADGQLFFAPSSWKDAAGQTIDDRAWLYALGPRARARQRPGEAEGAGPAGGGRGAGGARPQRGAGGAGAVAPSRPPPAPPEDVVTPPPESAPSPSGAGD